MEEPILDVILTPHRSLPPKGFLLVMGALGLLSFLAGLTFFLLGAWPIVGFLGLDVALVYVAFRLNYARARQFERVVVKRGEVSLEKVDVYGRRRHWLLPSLWLRVELAEPVEPSSRLTLKTHGKAAELGGFLSPQERKSLAKALQGALHAANR